MSATKEEIDRWVEVCRKPYVRDGKQPTRDHVIVALADQRDDAVALLEEADGMFSVGCTPEEPAGWVAKKRALLAKIGVTP